MAVQKDYRVDIDMHGNAIKEIKDASDLTDAVNMQTMIAYVAAHGGGGGGSGSITYTFPSASTTWTINHNLGYDPSVTVIIGIDQVQADVTHNPNHMTSYVNLGSPFSGKVVLS